MCQHYRTGTILLQLMVLFNQPTHRISKSHADDLKRQNLQKLNKIYI